MSDTGTLRLPSTIHFGYGVRQQLPRLAADVGRRALIVADPFLRGSAPLEALIGSLAQLGVDSSVYTAIEPELPVESLAKAAREGAAFDPDVVVGIGGGSALDAAKLIALLLSHGGPLSRYYGENAVPGPVLPLIAAPTTAGTGSEVTPVAVVSDPSHEMKVGISSPFLIPDAAVVDPELTLGAPSSVTAYSGIDALVHALESFTATPLELPWGSALPVFTGSNLLSRQLALAAMARIAPHLATAVEHPDDRAARENIAMGSLLAGMSFGSTGTHLSHALQYPIGAATKTPHGLGTGLMLPYVLQALLPAIRPQLSIADRALADEPGTGDPEAAIDRIAALCARIGIPPSLAQIGISLDELPGIAALALRSGRLVTIAPRHVDADFLLAILEAAWAGDRSRLDSSILS